MTRSIGSLVVALVVFALLPVSAAAEDALPLEYRERGDRIVSPGLVQAALQVPGREVKVWVFFTDKGIRDEAALGNALAGWRERLGARALDRRRAGGGGDGVDHGDLPVHAPYVDALRAAGFRTHHESRWSNGVSLTAPLGRLGDLEALPFVRWVQPVLVRGGAAPRPAPDAGHRGVLDLTSAPDAGTEAAFYGPSYKQLDQVQALDLHRLGYTGAGVRVMVLDTGFKKSHPVFQTCTNLVAERDFVNNDGNTENEGADPINAHYHGTGVWAALGGYAPGELIGPAWAAEFVVAKTEDVSQEVRAEEDNYVAALEWADTLAVDVASASLAYFDFDDGFTYTLADLDGDTAVVTRAVDIAAAKGMICVNAMGNSGPEPSTLLTPADADTIISVGAVDSVDAIVIFSSRGPTADGRIKPEICARGLATRWAQAWSDAYGDANGTSLATPLVGGLAALIKEAQPTWTGYDVREAVMATGTNAATPNNDLGWGVARGLDAIHHAGAVPELPRMTLPFALCDPPDSGVVTTLAPVLVWSPSEAPRPGDAAGYTVFVETFGLVDTIDAGSDTTLVLPPLNPGDEVRWWVHAEGNLGFVRKSMDERFFSVAASLDIPVGAVDRSLRLGAAHPNPTRSSVVILFAAPAGHDVWLEIVSVTGRLVHRLEGTATGAEERWTWDGRDRHGRIAAPGVYFYRLSAGEETLTRRLVRLP